MHLEILVEEPSVEAALVVLVPKIVGDSATFQIHVHQGKADLLASLPNRLRGYSHWLPEDWRIMVLTDEDRSDCHDLKNKLESVARHAGLRTKSEVGPSEVFQVVTRIAVEELEAWFFGDVQALCQAYPRVPRSLATRARYRDPDAIRGGTWESLERVLKQAGYHKGGLAKIATAREVSQHMTPEQNRSRSFQVFREGLLQVAGLPT